MGRVGQSNDVRAQGLLAGGRDGHRAHGIGVGIEVNLVLPLRCDRAIGRSDDFLARLQPLFVLPIVQPRGQFGDAMGPVDDPPIVERNPLIPLPHPPMRTAVNDSGHADLRPKAV